MNKIFAFVFLLSMGLSAQNGFEDWDKNYPLKNPSQIIKEELTYAQKTEQQTINSQYYLNATKYRFIATFTGNVRTLSAERLESMSRVIAVKFGKKDFISREIVNSEYEFEVGNQKIWMPIQKVLEASFKEEIEANKKVLLYTLFLNEHTDTKELYNLFFISEFTNHWTMPKKQLWAKSFFNKKAPELVVEKWLSEKPETSGKYVLIDFWATWYGPCRKAIPELNEFQKQFKDQLVVIGISDESKRTVHKMKSPEIEYYSAIDTKKRLKSIYKVTGVPHCVLIDPNGIVRWEGFPLLKNYELTTEVLAEIINSKVIQ